MKLIGSEASLVLCRGYSETQETIESCNLKTSRAWELSSEKLGRFTRQPVCSDPMQAMIDHVQILFIKANHVKTLS